MIATAGRLTFPSSPFQSILLLGVVLGAGGLLAAFALCREVLIPLASACLQACARDPMLMNLARGAASLAVAAAASGLLAGVIVLGSQLRATLRLVHQAEAHAVPAPPRLERLALQLGLEGRLTYVPDSAPYAFCYGFLAPRICVSSEMARTLTQRELRAVLLHEAFHLRHRDPLKVLISRALAGTLFLLPVAAELRDRYMLDKELSADAEVMDRLSPRPLARAILKICRSRTRQPVEALAAAAVGPFNLVGERIRHLAGPSACPTPLGRWKIATSLAVMVIFLATTVGAGYAAERAVPAGGSCCDSGSSCDLPAGRL